MDLAYVNPSKSSTLFNPRSLGFRSYGNTELLVELLWKPYHHQSTVFKLQFGQSLNGSIRRSELAVLGLSHFFKVSFTSNVGNKFPFTVESEYEPQNLP